MTMHYNRKPRKSTEYSYNELYVKGKKSWQDGTQITNGTTYTPHSDQKKISNFFANLRTHGHGTT